MRIVAGGRAFSVQCTGAGDPVVLVHGSGVGVGTWRGVVPRLVAAGRSVYAIELLGYGESDAAEDRAVLEVDLAGVLALVDHLGRVHLVGHSYGGLLVLLAALRRPVARLSLLEPVAFGVLHDAGDERGLADLDAFERGFPDLLDPVTGGNAAWLERFVNYWHGAGTWSAMADRQREALVRLGRKVFREVEEVRTARPDYDALGRVPAPIDLVHGELTTVAARRVIARLAERCPSATVHVIPGIGHLFPMLRPEQTARAILTPAWPSP